MLVGSCGSKSGGKLRITKPFAYLKINWKQGLNGNNKKILAVARTTKRNLTIKIISFSTNENYYFPNFINADYKITEFFDFESRVDLWKASPLPIII